MPTEQDLEQKLQQLKSVIKGLTSVLVAFSGGVDSTFLLKVCLDTLGSDNVLAVTAKSATYPERELQDAVRLAGMLGARHKIIESEELDIPGFSDNPPERCYYCKKELFGKLLDIARQEGLNFVVDGSNFDDTADFRPGMRAVRELGVRSPLKESGITKDDIRALSKKMGLPTWDKPSFACLSSRFPYGEKITKEKLNRVARAEEVLRNAGFSQYRVRSHRDIARIEVEPGEMSRFFDRDLREQVAQKIKQAGFSYVTLDLLGYRTGSMNEVLKEGEKAAWIN
ncbi:ATP-dependent sacrificial sulfur transferase LarE [Biomaibacter acetigenes]|uniref:ATP-dependent sacrificial sulfur transferase LarE n=1 Tax=Biomaibacter acetigenes TaxID=2316383 RepID=A0A3G2R8Z5_9FIRM|nr:ATP-dependent sacrificial sulfur transferase LarE [Biomaibacter acetigenes]AYO31498.1 ATP-dependent sacrificial sulfur transferase LarE [Biomaibacter acetigenes]